MPEISAPPSSSSVCPPPQLPDGISSDPEKEWRARDKKEDHPSQPKGSGSETPVSAPAASGADAATGARGRRVCGSDGGGGTHASKGQEWEGQERERGPGCEGSREGQHRQAERREGQRQRAQGSEGWYRQGRRQCADGEETAEAATHEGRSEGQSVRLRTERTECALQASGTWTGQSRGCEPGAGETLAVGEENSPETAGGRHAEQSPAWKKVDGPPKTTTGDKAEADDPGPKHADHGPLGEAPEAGSRGEVVRPDLGTPQQPQPVRSPVPSSRPEHRGRKSRSHHPCGGGDYRQDQLYKPDADSSSASASAPAADWGDRRAGRNSSAGVAQQFLHGDRTRCPEDAGCSHSSPRDARAKDPRANDAARRSSATGTIDTTKNDAEQQQEGEGFGGVGGQSKGFARSSANGCGNGPGRASGEADRTTVPAADQIGGTEHGQGGGSSKGQDVFFEEPSTSSCSVLARSLGEDGAPRPCAAAAFISPLPPAASMLGSASCLPVATAAARDCSHSAAVVKMWLKS